MDVPHDYSLSLGNESALIELIKSREVRLAKRRATYTPFRVALAGSLAGIAFPFLVYGLMILLRIH